MPLQKAFQGCLFISQREGEPDFFRVWSGVATPKSIRLGNVAAVVSQNVFRHIGFIPPPDKCADVVGSIVGFPEGFDCSCNFGSFWQCHVSSPVSVFVLFGYAVSNSNPKSALT